MIDDETDKTEVFYIISESGYLYGLQVNGSSLDDIELYKVLMMLRVILFLNLTTSMLIKIKVMLKLLYLMKMIIFVLFQIIFYLN